MLSNVDISDEPRKNRTEIEELAKDFDLGRYLRESINMYSGKKTAITLRCHHSILSDIITAFGHNIGSGKYDGEWLTVRVRAADNEGLYRWVMQYGGKIEIITPIQAREAVRTALTAALALYK
jgi:predicted DNA-binding transcriptional regulator YafY